MHENERTYALSIFYHQHSQNRIIIYNHPSFWSNHPESFLRKRTRQKSWSNRTVRTRSQRQNVCKTALSTSAAPPGDGERRERRIRRARDHLGGARLASVLWSGSRHPVARRRFAATPGGVEGEEGGGTPEGAGGQQHVVILPACDSLARVEPERQQTVTAENGVVVRSGYRFSPR